MSAGRSDEARTQRTRAAVWPSGDVLDSMRRNPSLTSADDSVGVEPGPSGTDLTAGVPIAYVYESGSTITVQLNVVAPIYPTLGHNQYGCALHDDTWTFTAAASPWGGSLYVRYCPVVDRYSSGDLASRNLYWYGSLTPADAATAAAEFPDDVPVMCYDAVFTIIGHGTGNPYIARGIDVSERTSPHVVSSWRPLPTWRYAQASTLDGGTLYWSRGVTGYGGYQNTFYKTLTIPASSTDQTVYMERAWAVGTLTTEYDANLSLTDTSDDTTWCALLGYVSTDAAGRCTSLNMTNYWHALPTDFGRWSGYSDTVTIGTKIIKIDYGLITQVSDLP